VREAIAHVSVQLGNTPTICRKCYVHPVVIETYLEKRPRRRPHRHLVRRGLRHDELSALSILIERVAA
jgi:DNA topoisomerase I